MRFSETIYQNSNIQLLFRQVETMPRKLPSVNPLTPHDIRKLEDLGQVVRNQRAQAKLRIDDAAALCFVSSNLLSRLENGRPVNVDKLLKVLDGLGLRMLVVPTGDAVLLESKLEGMRSGPKPLGSQSNTSKSKSKSDE